MKTKISIVIALLVFFGSMVYAQAGSSASAVIFLQGPGGTHSARLDPSGNATFDNVKPGTYTAALLLPAIQKVREAAASTSGPGKGGEIHIESFSWGVSNVKYDHAKGGGNLTNANAGGSGRAKTYDHALGGGSLTSKPTRVAGIHRFFGDVNTINHNGGSYYKIELKDILVSSVAQSSSSTESRPVESVSLNFTKIEYKY